MDLFSRIAVATLYTWHGFVQCYLVMRSFWSDPYLWIHLAGVAAVPLFLELCLAGFAVGDPILPAWLELFLVVAIGIAPILWMQWQRPFYIFSIVAVAIKPEQLTEDQRRLLTLFKTQRNQILAAIVPLLLILILRQVYTIAPVAAPVVPWAPGLRAVGLLVAAIGFLGCNLFVQVPVSVASVMLNSEATFAATVPYPLEQIRQSFTLLGLRVNQILPPLISEPKPTPVIAKPSPASIAPVETDETIDPWDIEATPLEGSTSESSSASEATSSAEDSSTL